MIIIVIKKKRNVIKKKNFNVWGKEKTIEETDDPKDKRKKRKKGRVPHFRGTGPQAQSSIYLELT